MDVTLLTHTPLEIAIKAIRTCWQSQDKSDGCGPTDIALVERVANKNKHASTIEHLSYTFDIDGISRACLQELARHRVASLSVKSSRYTLKELKDAPFSTLNSFVVSTGDSLIDSINKRALQDLQEVLQLGASNDIAKYMLPEAYKTSLVWTINARSLQNFLTLRTNKAALWEIRELANAVFMEIPNDHKFLFKDCLYKEASDATNTGA